MNDDSLAIQSTLRLVPWLARLPDDVLTPLAQASRMASFQDKEAIARRGRTLSHLHIVKKGCLSLSITGRTGRRHVFGQLQTGQVFGLIPVIEQASAIHDANSLGHSEVVLLPGDALFAAMQNNAGLAIDLLRVICQRSRRLQELLADRNLLPIGGQLVKVLLNMASLFGQTPSSHDGPIDLKISQASLADTLGISRQSLNNELKTLQALGCIELSYARVRLLDLPQLEAMRIQQD